jgi:hypothetical protein
VDIERSICDFRQRRTAINKGIRRKAELKHAQAGYNLPDGAPFINQRTDYAVIFPQSSRGLQPRAELLGTTTQYPGTRRAHTMLRYLPSDA